MKGLMVILLALSAFTAAMVPMRRREAVNAEEEEKVRLQSAEANGKRICASETPCAWSFFKPHSDIINSNITNSYCECGSGTSCQYDEHDTAVNTLVFKCKEETIDRGLALLA